MYMYVTMFVHGVFVFGFGIYNDPWDGCRHSRRLKNQQHKRMQSKRLEKRRNR